MSAPDASTACPASEGPAAGSGHSALPPALPRSRAAALTSPGIMPEIIFSDQAVRLRLKEEGGEPGVCPGGETALRENIGVSMEGRGKISPCERCPPSGTCQLERLWVAVPRSGSNEIGKKRRKQRGRVRAFAHAPVSGSGLRVPTSLPALPLWARAKGKTRDESREGAGRT